MSETQTSFADLRYMLTELSFSWPGIGISLYVTLWQGIGGYMTPVADLFRSITAHRCGCAQQADPAAVGLTGRLMKVWGDRRFSAKRRGPCQRGSTKGPEALSWRNINI